MQGFRQGMDVRGGPARPSPVRIGLVPVKTWLVLVAALALAHPTFADAQLSRATVEVEMVEFAFRPRIIRLEAGQPARIVLRNRGQIAHQFVTDYLRAVAVRLSSHTLDVEAPGLDLVRVDPGGSARLEFLPRRKGRFTVACTIEGHREAGMHGILEVR